MTKYVPAVGEFVEVVKNSIQALVLEGNTKRMAKAGDVFEVVGVDHSSQKILCRTRYGETHWGGKNLQGHQLFNVGDVKAGPLWFRAGNKVELLRDVSHAFKIENGQIRQSRKGDCFKVIQVGHGGDLVLVQSDPHPQFHVEWYRTNIDQTHYLYVCDLKRQALDCVCDNYTLGIAGCQCGWFQKEQELKRAAQTAG